MSRAFVKEDIEIVERPTRRRSASGLPPGALNYLTADGAQRLRGRLLELKGAAQVNEAEIATLERTLAAATIVEPPASPKSVVFGATVILLNTNGTQETYRIVGVDEVAMEAINVSWISTVGKVLLGAEPGQRVKFEDDEEDVWTVVKIV